MHLTMGHFGQFQPDQGQMIRTGRPSVPRSEFFHPSSWAMESVEVDNNQAYYRQDSGFKQDKNRLKHDKLNTDIWKVNIANRFETSYSLYQYYISHKFMFLLEI